MTAVHDIGWLTEERLMVCPGCHRWQLHYTWMALVDLIVWTVPISHEEPLDAALEPARECLEVIIRDHVAHECTHPRRVMELWQQRSRTR